MRAKGGLPGHGAAPSVLGDAVVGYCWTRAFPNADEKVAPCTQAALTLVGAGTCLLRPETTTGALDIHRAIVASVMEWEVKYNMDILERRV